jgi:hypothetical protein
MKTFLKTALVVVSVTAFSACDQAKDRRVDSDNPPVADQGNGKEVVSEFEVSCEYIQISSKEVDGKTVREEWVNKTEKKATRKTKDKGVNSEIEEEGRIENLTSEVAEDGSKTKKNELKYTFTSKIIQKREKISADTYSLRKDTTGTKTAEPGFNFGGKPKLDVKTLLELTYFDDGKITRDLSLKINGKEQSVGGEYQYTESEEGGYVFVVSTLKEPFKEGDATVEKDSSICKSKKLK